MAYEQKTVRENSESFLDIKVNNLLKEGWEISSDVKCTIKDINSVHEIWYQTVRKYLED